MITSLRIQVCREPAVVDALLLDELDVDGPEKVAIGYVSEHIDHAGHQVPSVYLHDNWGLPVRNSVMHSPYMSVEGLQFVVALQKLLTLCHLSYQ